METRVYGSEGEGSPQGLLTTRWNKLTDHMKKLILPLLSLLILLSNLHGRIWTSQSGQTFEGELVESNDKNVTILRTSDRRKFTMPISDLSKADQDYISNLNKQNMATPSQLPDRDRILNILNNIDYSKDLSSSLPAIKRSEGHKIAVEAEDHLMNERFDELEVILRGCLESRQMSHSGTLIYYQVLNELNRNPAIIDALNKWCGRSDTSHFAYALRGNWYVSEAWRQRGAGYSYTVTNSGWIGFGGNIKLARRDLERAYDLNPNDYFVLGRMIVVCMADGSDDLITWFERAVNINYLYCQAYVNLAYANYPRWGGSLDILIPIFDYLLENTPNGGKAYLILIQWYEMNFNRQLKDPKSDESIMADKLVKRFIKEFPESDYGWRQLARLAQLQGQYKIALGYLDTAMKFDQTASLWERKGECLKMLGQYKDSYNAYLKAIELNPHNHKSWSALGYNNLYKRHDHLAAIDCFKKALIYSPNREYYLRHIALAYCFMGDLDTALARYNELIASGGGTEWAYFGRGLTYWCMGEYQAANKDFEKSISISSRMKTTIASYKEKLKKVEGGKPQSYEEYLANRKNN